jgi:flagellar FliL protein
MATETTPALAGEPPKKSSRAAVLGAAGGVALLGGLGWVYFARQSAQQAADKASQSHAVAAVQADSFYDMDEFLVNLSNPEGERYLRTTLSLSFAHESARDAIKTQLPKVRDAIIDILADQKTQDLISADGRAKVKAAILARLALIVPTAGFDGVYFQLFTFQ